MIRCRDGALYTGISLDVSRRFDEHCAAGPRGARYLRGRGPLTLVLAHEIGERTLALKLERAVKRLPKDAKERLVARPALLDEMLPKIGGGAESHSNV